MKPSEQIDVERMDWLKKKRAGLLAALEPPVAISHYRHLRSAARILSETAAALVKRYPLLVKGSREERRVIKVKLAIQEVERCLNQ